MSYDLTPPSNSGNYTPDTYAATYVSVNIFASSNVPSLGGPFLSAGFKIDNGPGVVTLVTGNVSPGTVTQSDANDFLTDMVNGLLATAQALYPSLNFDSAEVNRGVSATYADLL